MIRNWLRNRNAINFLGIWEQLNNPDFKPVEFDGFKKQAGLNSFTLTPKQWIEKTNAIGLISKTGRYGGTYAHKDIAFEFASGISIKFKLHPIKEFQRLKDEELKQLGWDIKRNLVKINYRIHTDAIKNNLIPSELARNFLLITPNIIVLDRIRSDFEGLRIFFEDPVLPDNGFEDLDVPLKMKRLQEWCVDINKVQSDIDYDYVFVDEESFNKYQPRSFKALMSGFKRYKAPE